MQNIINEKMKNNRIYIAIDLKSFYASVECVERGLDPLTTNLVVADVSRTEKTICLAVSPSLKAYGISGRARLFEVVQKVNEIKKLTGRQIDYIVASPRMHKYIEVSAAIYEEYLKYVSSEDIHVYSIDEVFIDITDYLTLYEMTSYEITVNIIHNIYEKTRITATAGIGTNLYLAKIAMDIMAKHVQADADGVRIASLDEMTYRKYLWNHTPITDFWRVGKGIANRLEQSGIYTMGDIARTSLHNAGILSDMFGVDAQLLIDHAWGYEPCTIADIKKYKPSTNSISSGQVLGCAYEYDRARIVVKEMADEIALELVSERKVTQSVTLTLGYDRIDAEHSGYHGEMAYDGYGRRVPKSAHGTAALSEATNSSVKLVEAFSGLFDRIMSRQLKVKRFTLCANNITEEGFEQLSLFTDTKESERERKLQETMIDIKNKFGKNAILKGMNLEKGATAKERNNQIGGHKA